MTQTKPIEDSLIELLDAANTSEGLFVLGDTIMKTDIFKNHEEIWAAYYRAFCRIGLVPPLLDQFNLSAMNIRDKLRFEKGIAPSKEPLGKPNGSILDTPPGQNLDDECLEFTRTW